MCGERLEPSRLPTFSDGPESIGEDPLFGEHRGETLDERSQSLFGHVRHEIVGKRQRMTAE